MDTNRPIRPTFPIDDDASDTLRSERVTLAIPSVVASCAMLLACLVAGLALA